MRNKEKSGSVAHSSTKAKAWSVSDLVSDFMFSIYLVVYCTFDIVSGHVFGERAGPAVKEGQEEKLSDPPLGNDKLRRFQIARFRYSDGKVHLLLFLNNRAVARIKIKIKDADSIREMMGWADYWKNEYCLSAEEAEAMKEMLRVSLMPRWPTAPSETDRKYFS